MDNTGKTGQRGKEEGDYFQLERSEEDTVLKLALGYILCKVNDTNLRERDERGKVREEKKKVI